MNAEADTAGARAELVRVLAVDARIREASYEVPRGIVVARFGGGHEVSTDPLSMRPRIERVNWRLLSTVLRDVRESLRASGSGSALLRASELGPRDPVPCGSRFYSSADDAERAGYANCYAGAPSFLDGFAREAARASTAIAITRAVEMARVIATMAAVEAQVAPQWRAAWEHGYAAAAERIARRRAELERTL